MCSTLRTRNGAQTALQQKNKLHAPSASNKKKKRYKIVNQIKSKIAYIKCRKSSKMNRFKRSDSHS